MACSNYTHTPLPHFSTAALIDLIGNLGETCPHDLVDGIGVRDAVADKLFQGENSFFAESLGRWSPYAAAIIFSRLIDFKLPLLQLISQLPRPQIILGWWTQVFSVLHLIGDPIDSMSGYLFTLATCMVVLQRTKEIMVQRERERAEAEAEPIEAREVEEEEGVERRCKLIALVYLSYASNGHPKKIEDLISCEAAHPATFEAAALALAADCGSNFWAVGVAIFGFSMAVVLKYVYLDAETFDVTNQHIDIWSLSSSMTMVHIVPNVLLASIISVQQSPHTVRRFLEQFEERLRGQGTGRVIDNMQTDWAQRDPDRQISNGAVPNWRPDRQYARLPLQHNAPSTLWRRVLDVVAFLIVTTGSAGAIWLAAAVPPQGLNCRTVIKLIMVSIYVVKYAVQLLVNRLGAPSTPMKMCYRQCKDGGECGVYPASVTWGVVQKRLHGMYPGILFGFLGMQILFCAGLLYVFREARKVFLQDDEPLAEGEGEGGMDQRRENQDIQLRPMIG
ncbi:hypothetical protein EDB81DRAFT_751552 [Dactylonectria macrodidyma]|uniref:Uncharacterized protein n=1 Tax=Dactylonectria macrodidyma TaxID=307937 RepID=A0A9P9JRD2_9HYPO|nr:hypothetical protein EDB81DRAFT_751552 [Dactylonectria macrodidyma]